MKLQNRLTLFFTLTLLLVLGGFSLTLYLLARAHLSRQMQTQLDSALDTLVAAAELKQDGVEWEPAERRLDFSAEGCGEALVWQVADLNGKIIDISGPARDTGSQNRAALPAGNWQVAQRDIRPNASLPNDSNPPEASDRTATFHSGLRVTVGLPLAPMQASLSKLAITLSSVSSAVFLLSLMATRWVCMRGLAPLRAMASAAREMDSVDLSERLPVVHSQDEVGDLAGSFNGLLNRLQESFERQRRFTGDASHQLRTPLAAILGQIEVAQRRDRSIPEYQQTLQSVFLQASHLHQVVEALLFLARSDCDAQQLPVEPIELTTWLNQYFDSWKTHPRWRDFRTQLGSDLGRIFGQPVLLGELLNILLDNACRYSRTGTFIHLRAERNDGGVRVDITDQGPGITVSDAPRVFDPFSRLQNGNKTSKEGAGLGLSIAARLAKVLGGSLSVASALGEGSTFSLYLPSELASTPLTI